MPLVDTVIEPVVEWWDRVIDEPAWLTRLEHQVEAAGLGPSSSRCFLGNSHRRRRVAKWMVGGAVACALSPYGYAEAALGLALAVVLVTVRLPHETLRVPPSRVLDGCLAAGFLIVPQAVLALGGFPTADTTGGVVELLTIPLAVAAAVLVLIDSWFFTRAIWFTCDDGLVASTGRGRIRTSFRWADVQDHRIESTLRPLPEADEDVLTDEWWLTLADGRTEHLFLHLGSALYPERAWVADPLTVSLAHETGKARVDVALAAVRRGAPVTFGRITASLLDLEIDGVTVPWSRLPRKAGWGRHRWNGGWRPATPHWLYRVRSVLFVDLPDGRRLGVPTRDVNNLFVLWALQLRLPRAQH